MIVDKTDEFDDRKYQANQQCFGTIGGISGQGLAQSKPKTFNECSIEEKINRLRDEVRSLRAMFISTAQSADRTFEQFVGHEHLNGKIVTPIDRYGKCGTGQCGQVVDPLA